MIQGEIDKASQIFENAMKENDVYNIVESGTEEQKMSMLQPANHELGCIIFNYIKCNAIKNGHMSIVAEGYQTGGLQ